MAYGYDKNVDYQKLINQDVAAQDFRSAAIHEAQRNEKIRGEGATQYQTTSHYSDYLPRDQQINSGMDQLQSAKFSYDKENDPAYQAFRKEYLREADRQTRNAMGAASQMTGGAVSTAAMQAGQQAGQYQVAQLADRVPELYNQAFSRWNTEQDNARANLNLMQGIEQQRQNNSLALQQWDWNRRMGERQQDFTEQQQAIQNAMNRWAQAGVADEYVASILGVPVGTSTADQSYRQWQQQITERELGNTEQQQAWANAFNLWTTMGTANEYVSSVLGVPVGTSTSDQSYRQWQQQITERELGNTEQQQAWSNAFNLWTTTGVADEYVASVLGVPVGATTQSADYQQWQQQMAERQQGQSEQSDARSLVMALLQTGHVPSAEQLAAAGISQTDAQTIANYYAGQMGGGTAGSGGRYSSGGSGRGSGGGSGSGSGNGSEDEDTTDYYSDSEFQGVLGTLRDYNRTGQGYNAAEAYLTSVGSRLSAEQTQQVIRLMNQLFPQVNKPGESTGRGTKSN